MATNKTTTLRADKKFMRELEDIKLKRLTLGKDNLLKPVKSSRVTLAMTRHPLFPRIKQDIIQADLP